MYKYKTIIFDLDGTLYKTDEIFSEALCQLCVARDIEPWDKKRIAGMIGVPMVEICRQMFGADTPDEEIEQIRAHVRAAEKSLLKEKGVIYDGTEEMLRSLKSEGYTLCICSNGSKPHVDNILEAFGLAELFTIIKTRIEGLSKSQLIKQILDESASSSAIFVGDRIIDFEAAEDTGCMSIGVSYGYGGDEHEKADFSAHTAMDVYYIVRKINKLYCEIYKQIIAGKVKGKPLIVGINGVDTSGKSTITKELGKYLKKSGFKVQAIHMDDFHNPSVIRMSGPDPITSYTHNAFNLNRLEKQLLEPIASNCRVDKTLMHLDLQKDEYTKLRKYEVDADTIVLIEGVLLYREPINKYFDFRIFVDISFEEVLERAARRDSKLFGDAVVEKYQKKYIPIQKLYMENYLPVEISDMVINNEDFNNPIISKQKEPGITDKQSNSRVSVRPVEERYYKQIREMHLDDEVRDMLGVIALPETDYFLDKNNICYVIINKNEEFAGIVELFNLSWKNRRAEMSIAIKSEFRGKGYGQEAITQMLDVAFGEFGFQRIWLRVLENNRKAIECYKRVGFVIEGVCRKESLRGGIFKSQVQMSMLKNEWLEQKQKS